MMMMMTTMIGNESTKYFNERLTVKGFHVLSSCYNLISYPYLQFRLSCISGISELSGADWKPTAGPFAWVQNQMMRGTDPRDLLKDMISADSVIPGTFKMK